VASDELCEHFLGMSAAECFKLSKDARKKSMLRFADMQGIFRVELLPVSVSVSVKSESNTKSKRSVENAGKGGGKSSDSGSGSGSGSGGPELLARRMLDPSDPLILQLVRGQLLALTSNVM
jgi:hypothetical protein